MQTNLTNFILQNWQILVGFSLPALVMAAWRMWRYTRNMRWAGEIVKSYRRSGNPVLVYLDDRQRLEWAIQERLLQVVDTFKGGWAVIEFQLGPGVVGTS
jgi:hypothetical protein